MKELRVTLQIGDGESVTTTYPESRMHEAFLLYSQYMHNLKPGQSVIIITENSQPLFY